jgi:hypothetical protein
MKSFLNADPKKNKPTNVINSEIHRNVEANTSVTLNHDIFFSDGLVIQKIVGENFTPLVINNDYDLEDIDDVATEISGLNCFKRIKFYYSYNKVKVSYHAYGDFIKAEDINDIVDEIERVANIVEKEEVGILPRLDALEDILNEGENSLDQRVTTIETRLNVSKRTVNGNGELTSFSFSGLPTTAHGFEFRLNHIPLEDADYSWNFSSTTGNLEIKGFIPLPEDTIEMRYRS